MKKKKRPVTLIEMMVVITLIGVIAALVGYNMQGVLQKTKIKQTELAIEKIKDILELEISLNPGINSEDLTKSPEKYLKKSELVKDANKLLKDGWGNPIKVELSPNGELSVYSEKLASLNEPAKK